MAEDCIFCKIAQKQQKAELVYQDDQVVAFKDIHPMAPVHILIIPVKHITNLDEMTEQDINLLGKMIFTAKQLAQQFGTDQGGYKLLFRNKKHGGQVVDHIHLHLIGGAPLYEEIRPLTKGGEKNG